EDVGLDTLEDVKSWTRAAVEAFDGLVLSDDPFGLETAGVKGALGMIRQAEIAKAALAGRSGHVLERVRAVRFSRVRVQDAVQIGQADEVWQVAGESEAHFLAGLAQFRRDEGQS